MFKRLFGRGKGRSEETKQIKLSNEIRNSILGTLGSHCIPPMPQAAQKAFQLSIDPNAEASQFVEVIESDEALSARVIKIANSVYFERGKKSQTIEESINVIGINELRCILNASTLSEVFPSRHPLRSQFWANDIATALISRTLAQKLTPGREEVAFLGGLMHDIGKLLLLQRGSEYYEKIIKNVEQTGLEFHKAETEIFVFDHTEVGLLVGERWSFTPELLHIIRRHHASWNELKSEKEQISLTGIVKAADTIANALGLGLGSKFFRLKQFANQSLDEVWSYLNIPESEQQDMIDRCKKVFESEYELYCST